MNYRRLGKTGFEVSEIGFGAWGIGGSSNGVRSYGVTDDGESKRALKRALELGVTFYDTSDLYGGGHSEHLIGAVFKTTRKTVIIASKVGFVDKGNRQDFSPWHIRNSLEATLERLQTDYLDLYQLHSPPLELLERDPSVFGTLEALRKEGKIRAFGISVRSPQDGLIAVEKWNIQSIQVNLNMIDQRALEIGLAELCQGKGIGLIARTPLCFGFLTGRYSLTSTFDSQDHRSTWSAEQVALWVEACQLFTSLVEKRHQTHAQIALRFCLSYPEISAAIPGMLTPEQVEENILASEQGPLPQEDLLEIDTVYRGNTFFVEKSKT